MVGDKNMAHARQEEEVVVPNISRVSGTPLTDRSGLCV